jgi:hypothetical protein
VRGERVELPVDGGVDAAEKEARHRGNGADGQARMQARVQAPM